MPENGFKKTPLLRDVFTLFTGTTIAQVIPVAIQPVLRRLFTPEEFGNYALYISIASTLIVIATMRYELAIVLPEKDKDGINLLALSQIISILVCSLSFLCIIFLKPYILNFLNIEQSDSNFLYFIPLGAFLFSSYQSFNYWLTRKKAFKQSAINKISRRSSEALIQFIQGINNIKHGLIYGDIIGRIILLFTGALQSIKKQFDFKEIKLSSVLQVARDYKDFPIYNAIPAVLNTASLMVPILLITKLYSREITGQVDLCVQLLGLPLSLISASVSQVLYQRIAEYKQKNNSIVKIYQSLLKSLLIMAFLGILLVELFGKWGINIIFGEQWTDAGTFILIMVISYGIKFIVSPLSIILTALDKLKALAIWQFGYFITILTLSFLDFLDIKQFLITYMGIDIIAYGMYLLLINHYVVKYEKIIGRHKMES